MRTELQPGHPRPTRAPRALRRRPIPAARARPGLPALGLLAGGLAACAPELPGNARERGQPELLDAPPLPALTVESFPAGFGEAIPPVARLLVGPGPLDPEELLLVEGEVSEAQRRNVAAGRISKALEARRVPATLLGPGPIPKDARGGGDGEGTAAIVVPSRPLEPGLRHTLIAREGTALSFEVEAGERAALLERVWPLPGQALVARFGIFCGEVDLGEAPRVPTLFDPAPFPGAKRHGAARLLPDGLEVEVVLGLGKAPGEGPPLAPACARLSPRGYAAGADRAALPPARLETSAGTFALDPRPLAAEAGPPEAPPEPFEECLPEELSFGPGCARLADDRAFVRASGFDALFAWGGVSGSARPSGWVVAPAESTFLVPGLEASAPLALEVVAWDAAGRGFRGALEGTTRKPSAHLVLSEALANPKGSEPAQEWVEIVNDGAIAAELEGYVLADVGGETKLGPGTIPPGAYALVVRDDYAPDPELDPVAPEGTQFIRVPAIGKAGLSNEGELLRLRDPEGRVVSRLLPSEKPKPGESLARIAPKAPDVPASFFAGPPTPGRGS